ncbi:MAG: phosphopantetheine-binding protein [Planctomycetota bacterium]|nr:phosphopantetheine-binding protein [Planctomycetota bacterium]
MKTTNEMPARSGLSRENVLADITKIVAEHMDQPAEGIGEDDHLVNDIGCDSLDITEIVMMIEDDFDIEIPEEHVQDARTPDEVTDGVFKLLGETESD